MTTQELGFVLASLNATLTFSTSVLLLFGFRFIRRKEVRKHQWCMVAAFVTSAVFLVSYVVRFLLVGNHSFDGPDWLRTPYLTILFSHMVLAVAVLPLVLRTLFLARRKRVAEHRRLARWTFPVWLYVSVTGFMVYLLLYHVQG